MITENKILKQVTVLSTSNTVQVQWANQIVKDGVVIAETFERCAYDLAQKDKFLAEVEGAAAYVAILGW